MMNFHKPLRICERMKLKFAIQAVSIKGSQHDSPKAGDKGFTKDERHQFLRKPFLAMAFVDKYIRKVGEGSVVRDQTGKAHLLLPCIYSRAITSVDRLPDSLHRNIPGPVRSGVKIAMDEIDVQQRLVGAAEIVKLPGHDVIARSNI